MTPHRRPLPKRAMMAARRLHLYFGLLLAPWAVLYGVSGFLFNHPTVFSDQPTTSFGRAELAGTPMEAVPTPAAVAADVVRALNERGTGVYTLTEPEAAAYAREFAFATVKADPPLNVLFDVTGAGGTVRQQQGQPKAPERPPFATGPARPGRERRERENAPPADGLVLPDTLADRVRAAAPAVLDRTGFPAGAVTVTSVPDLLFRVADADGRVWPASYNALAGSVGGGPSPGEEPTARRFLTRLHLAHGYPSSGGVRWLWAVLVDAMAFVMVFWAVSGLLMWWQLKAARRLGIVVVVFSVVLAAYLGSGMHAWMSR